MRNLTSKYINTFHEIKRSRRLEARRGEGRARSRQTRLKIQSSTINWIINIYTDVRLGERGESIFGDWPRFPVKYCARTGN